jgi:hypothetical protein
MEPLADLKNDIFVPVGLGNRAGLPIDGVGDHAGGCGSFLTCVQALKSDVNVQNNISIDQAIAKSIGGQTRFASLQLGLSGARTSGRCDSGFSCAYMDSISWAGPSSPMVPTSNPSTHFDRLFAGGVPALGDADAARRKALNLSVMDYVNADIKKLETRLGQSDRAKLDEYLSGIRGIEQQLNNENVMTQSCEKGNRPGNPGDPDQKANLFADLMVLAFQCDLTRVQTFMLTGSQSYRSYSNLLKYGGPVANSLGIKGQNLENKAHHDLSHHQGNKKSQAGLEEINRHEVNIYGNLLRKLKNAKDVTGKPLLDSSIVFMSNEISDGDMHNHNNMPVIIGGKGNGAITTGRAVVYGDATPSRGRAGPTNSRFSELFISIAQAMGATNVTTFGKNDTEHNRGGYGSAPLSGLKA